MSSKFPDHLDPQKYPDFWQQMKNFSSFLKEVGQDVSEGHGIFVTEQKCKERVDICNECSQFNKESKRCYICGCFMENKIKFKSSKCPLSKW